LTWRQLDHPNIVKFLGVYYEESEGRQRLSLVSVQIEDHLRNFLLSRAYNPHVDRKRLVSVLIIESKSFINDVLQLTEIANAVVYLHDQGIAHGDISLVSSSPHAPCTVI
jgi:serine/threonine protein kinase